MRKTYLYLTVLLYSFLLLSCKDAEIQYVSQLTLSQNSVVFDMNGAEKSIQVSPFPADLTWEASVPESYDWFSFETDASSLTVKVQPNYSLESRIGQITLTSPDGDFDPYHVSVMQEPAEPLEFSSTIKDHKFDSEGGKISFMVKSNYDWTLEYDASWLTVLHYVETGKVVIECKPNESEESRTEILTLYAGGNLDEVHEIVITQGTRAENPYLNLLGQWEITAAKWYYSPNGSLNSLDYNPSQTEYYLIFDLEQGEYGKTFIMRDFLYPDTSLEVRYDSETGNIVIPFGWTVYSYDVYMYITVVGDTKFSYASLEVEGVPSSDFATIDLQLPKVDGFKYVGFGLWTYNDNGDKVALGSRSRPTMFPMGPIVFRKYSI